MANLQNTNIKTLLEIRDGLRGACEAFAKIPAGANGQSWISVCGVQVRVGDLRVAAAAYRTLEREIKRRRVATTRVYVQYGNDCWRLTLSKWIELCEAGANGGNSDPANFDGTRLMGLPLEVEEYCRKARAKGAVPRYTHRKEFFYAEPHQWTAADFQSWLDEWHKEY